MSRANKGERWEKEKSHFATTLRLLMDKQNATQAQLAEVTGKTRQTVSQYVNGISEPGYDTLVKIAEHFRVSTDFLLGLTNDPSPKVSIPMDSLGLPMEICDMLFEHNKKDSLQRKGLEALCKTGEFFKLLEKVGILCETMGPYDLNDCPENIRNQPLRIKTWVETRLKLLNDGVGKDFPDLFKHGKFCYGQEYNDVLRYQIAQLMEKALDFIMGGKR